MTGAYLRVKRGGKWEAVEVERLTPEERRELLGHRSAGELMRWMDVMCDALVAAERDRKGEQ
jgi:hypothetical protein